MTGQVQDLNLNASSLFVPGVDGKGCITEVLCSLHLPK